MIVTWGRLLTLYNQNHLGEYNIARVSQLCGALIPGCYRKYRKKKETTGKKGNRKNGSGVECLLEKSSERACQMAYKNE